MAYEGFGLSETLGLPVMLRVTTRLAHSRAGVTRRDPQREKSLKLPENRMQFMLLPSFARKSYQALLGKQERLASVSELSRFNCLADGKDTSLGIICCGLAYNYLMENFKGKECPYPVLKISHYPLPSNLVRKIETICDVLLVLEEGYPLVEEQLTDYFKKGTRVKGRLDGSIPRTGELNPGIVATALGRQVSEGFPVPGIVASRPPALPSGCVFCIE